MHNGPAHIAIIFIHSQSVGRLCRCPTHTFDYIVDDSMDFRFQQMFRRGDDYHNEIILLAWNGNNCTKSKCQMTISSFLFFFPSFLHTRPYSMSTDWPQMKLCNWMATKDTFEPNEKIISKKINFLPFEWIIKWRSSPAPDHIICHISQFPSFVCQMRSPHTNRSQLLVSGLSNNVVHNERATRTKTK